MFGTWQIVWLVWRGINLSVALFNDGKTYERNKVNSLIFSVIYIVLLNLGGFFAVFGVVQIVWTILITLGFVGIIYDEKNYRTHNFGDSFFVICVEALVLSIGGFFS